MNYHGTTSGPRELCPLCNGHGMVEEGTNATRMLALALAAVLSSGVGFVFGVVIVLAVR